MSDTRKETEELAVVAPHVSELLQSYVSARPSLEPKPYDEAKYLDFLTGTD